MEATPKNLGGQSPQPRQRYCVGAINSALRYTSTCTALEICTSMKSASFVEGLSCLTLLVRLVDYNNAKGSAITNSILLQCHSVSPAGPKHIPIV